MIEWTSGKLEEVTQLARQAGTVVAIVVVLMTYYKARAIVPVIVAALVAGVFLWTINNPTWWQERVGDESGALGVGPGSVEAGQAGHVVVWAPPPGVEGWGPS